MIYSIKHLISNSPQDVDSGIFTISTNPTIIIADRDGKPVNSYHELVSIEDNDLSESDKDFVAEVWDKTEKFWINKRATMQAELEMMKENSASQEEIEKMQAKIKSAKCYNGHVTSVIDVLYDPEQNTVTYMMDRCRYSLSRATSMDNFPNRDVIANKLSFGLGMGCLMDIEIAPLKSSLLMLERSDTVHTEKKAFCIPAGTMEYTEECDPIKIGLKAVALNEVYEEILATRQYMLTKHPELSRREINKFPEFTFDSALASIQWARRPNGTVGLNNFHNIISDKTISMENIFTGYTQAEDANESTGEMKFVNLESESKLVQPHVVKPHDIVALHDKIDPETKTKKLDHTGIAALTTAYVSHTRQNFSDFTPSLAALAEEFAKFNILEFAQLNNKIIPPNPYDTTIPKRAPYLRIKDGKADTSPLKEGNHFERTQ
ncbi:MAG: hypothetical protein V4694_05140 [Pseudomonadota bacterium]